MLVAGAALDLLFLGQQALEVVARGRGAGEGGGRRLGTAVTETPTVGGGHGAVPVGRVRGGEHAAGLTLFGAATSTTGGHETTGAGLARGLTGRHGRFARDLVLRGQLVGKDVALVDPHLDPDAAEGRLGLAEPVVDVGPQGVERDP